MNTAMMVTRVSLLLVVTGLFAGMWSADCPDCRTDAEKLIARRNSIPQFLARAEKSEDITLRQSTVAKPVTALSIPLPTGISPGTYLVVDQSGATQHLTVNEAAAMGSTNFVPVDQYTVKQGDRRWHFIRLEKTTTPKLAQPTRRGPLVDLR